MRSPCNDCPFVKSSPLEGAPDWLNDLINSKRSSKYFYHTCHKTDPNADGFVGGKKAVECADHLQMILNECDGKQGEGGVYNSVDELIERYLRSWLGDKDFEAMKSAHTKRLAVANVLR